MVEWLCKIYKGVMDVIAFIILLIFAVIGYNFGYKLDYEVWMGVIGIIFGAGIGLVIEIIVIPPLTILFSIDSKLDKLLKTNNSVDSKEKNIQSYVQTNSSSYASDTKKSDENTPDTDERKEDEISELKTRIKSYDDLLNDPKIKDEAETLKKFYGTEAYEHFLERKAKELGLEK